MIRFALASALLWAAPAAAQDAPSFDCDRARTATEFAVCGDLTLSRLDLAMAEGYFDRLATRRYHFHEGTIIDEEKDDAYGL
mgnify:CR=1 FL=1